MQEIDGDCYDTNGCSGTCEACDIYKEEQTPLVSEEITYVPTATRTPHRCPVCYGKGIVPNSFYNCAGDGWSSTITVPETCRTCGGTGIVWG